jgi:hypothetical protein
MCERDDIFPIAASLESLARVGKIYDLFDAAALVEQETFRWSAQLLGQARSAVPGHTPVRVTE